MVVTRSGRSTHTAPIDIRERRWGPRLPKSWRQSIESWLEHLESGDSSISESDTSGDVEETPEVNPSPILEFFEFPEIEVPASLEDMSEKSIGESVDTIENKSTEVNFPAPDFESLPTDMPSNSETRKVAVPESPVKTLPRLKKKIDNPDEIEISNCQKKRPLIFPDRRRCRKKFASQFAIEGTTSTPSAKGITTPPVFTKSEKEIRGENLVKSINATGVPKYKLRNVLSEGFPVAVKGENDEKEQHSSEEMATESGSTIRRETQEFDEISYNFRPPEETVDHLDTPKAPPNTETCNSSIYEDDDEDKFEDSILFAPILGNPLKNPHMDLLPTKRTIISFPGARIPNFPLDEHPERSRCQACTKSLQDYIFMGLCPFCESVVKAVRNVETGKVEEVPVKVVKIKLRERAPLKSYQFDPLGTPIGWRR
ncbi:hypothetical protein RUND412_008655 [Rhizina undulata]